LNPSTLANLIGGLGVEGLNLETTTDVPNPMSGEFGGIVQDDGVDIGYRDREIDTGEELGAEHADAVQWGW
jgi:hypothetical protein